jgi:hypothetical protein
LAFRWINKQGVESDLGFVVQRRGRFTCEYSEASKSIELEVESGTSSGRPSVVIMRNAFAKWSTARAFHETSVAEQARLMKNFKDAMAFQGLVVDVC